MFFKSRHIFVCVREFVLSGVAALLLLPLCLTVAFAQRTGEINSGMIGNEQILGRIVFPPGDKSGARPVIKLQSLSSPEITAVTDQDGSFRFTHLRPDTYTVIVEGGAEYESAGETVVIVSSGTVPAQGSPGQYAVPYVYQVRFDLKPKRDAALFANVPVPAQELYRLALESARAGDHEKAIEQLKSAIAQAPKFTFAYNELAKQYLKIGQGDRAVETLKESLVIEPENTTLRLSYGIALVNQKKFAAAEAELRPVYQKKNADSPTAGYYLGLALMSQQKTEEAGIVFETVITNGGDQIALAHKYLGGIYWRDRKYSAAADELEKYLKLEPKASDAEKVRNTIVELRHRSNN